MTLWRGVEKFTVGKSGGRSLTNFTGRVTRQLGIKEIRDRSWLVHFQKVSRRDGEARRRERMLPKFDSAPLRLRASRSALVVLINFSQPASWGVVNGVVFI